MNQQYTPGPYHYGEHPYSGEVVVKPVGNTALLATIHSGNLWDGALFSASFDMLEALKCQADADNEDGYIRLSVKTKWSECFEKVFGSNTLESPGDLHLLAKELRRRALAKAIGPES